LSIGCQNGKNSFTVLNAAKATPKALSKPKNYKPNQTRHHTLIGNAMKLNKRMIAAAAALAMSLGVLSGGQMASAANQTTLTIGSLIEPSSWSPAKADLGHAAPYYQAVYDNLITRKPDGTYAPNLATKWSFQNFNSTLIMQLRKDVKFSDGTAFDATVAKANLDAFINGTGPYASSLAGTSVSVVDKYTIQINISGVNPDILYYLATTDSYMASPNAIGSSSINTKPVGSGPYLYDSSSVPGSQIVFTANPNYWDKKKIKFQRIVFKTMADVTARLNALLSGQIDATLLDAKTGATAQGRGMTEYSNNVDWLGLLMMDRDGALDKDLADVRVRQAIGYSIDRAALLKAVQGGYGTVTEQPFGKISGANDPALDSYYTVDNAKAKSLLAAAGHPNGFTLNLPAWPDPTMRALLSDQLSKSGITINWVSVPAADYRNQLKQKKWAAGIFQLGLAAQTPWVTINFVAAPQASWNVFNSTDPVIAGALKSINKDRSPKNVIAQSKVINKFLVTNAWYLPFYQLPQLFYTDSHVKTVNQPANAVPYIYNYAPTGK
jgi:peptide/nickel transport system substrate-binding protein